MKDPFIGKKIQNYLIDSPLGQSVYKGEDTNTGRPVKIKILGKSEDYEVKKMVEMASTLSVLNSPGLVRIYNTLEDDLHYYFILEHFQGKTLHQLLSEGKEFSLEESFQIILSIAEGLDKGHRLGVVHQNIYPKTILIGENNVVKLPNFGLNLKIGKTAFDIEEIKDIPFEQGSELKVDEESFLYWSPELYNDQPLDARSDIFSLGVVFFHLVTGKYPHEANNSIGYLNKLATEPPIHPTKYSPRIPVELEEIILKMIQPKSSDRFRTVSKLLDTLTEFQRARGYEIRFGGLEEKEYVAKSFIAMPFDPRFDAVYKAISKACESNHVQPIRIDNIVDVDNIWEAILREIADSEFVIADFSGDKYEDCANLNVVTEAAHARALKKPVVLICQKPETMVFDWRVHYAIKYNMTKEGLDFLTEALGRKIEACLRLVRKLEAEDIDVRKKDEEEKIRKKDELRKKR